MVMVTMTMTARRRLAMTARRRLATRSARPHQSHQPDMRNAQRYSRPQKLSAQPSPSPSQISQLLRARHRSVRRPSSLR
jgi:hypothetical protein